MKLKVSELEGGLLDAMVAKAEGFKAKVKTRDDGSTVCFVACDGTRAYSSYWEDGGPIIERERIETGATRSGRWGACVFDSHEWQYGPTILIAAMRCYVESKFGPEIEME